MKFIIEVNLKENKDVPYFKEYIKNALLEEQWELEKIENIEENSIKSEIFKDTSGKTFGFRIFKGKEEFLFGDGYKTKKEIIDDFNEYKNIFVNLEI